MDYQGTGLPPKEYQVIDQAKIAYENFDKDNCFAEEKLERLDKIEREAIFGCFPK